MLNPMLLSLLAWKAVGAVYGKYCPRNRVFVASKTLKHAQLLNNMLR
jgi:hypothetical protein